jgi:hypothetical protein
MGGDSPGIGLGGRLVLLWRDGAYMARMGEITRTKRVRFESQLTVIHWLVAFDLVFSVPSVRFELTLYGF